MRSIALWNRVNLAAADFGERVLGAALPARPLRGSLRRAGGDVGAILGFFGLEGDVEAAAAEVRPPDSLGPLAAPPAEGDRRDHRDRPAGARALRLPLSEARGEGRGLQLEPLARGGRVRERREEPLDPE